MNYYTDGSCQIGVKSAHIVTDDKGNILGKRESTSDNGETVNTNNVEEYQGVIMALEICSPGDSIFTDSQLVANQISGKYQVSAEHLIPYCEKAKALARQKGVYPQWIPREKNIAGIIFEKGELQMDEIIKTGEKTAIKVEEYKGVISLSSQREGNGKYWGEWAKYRKGKDAYQEKDWPVKVTLGKKEDLPEVLRQIASSCGISLSDIPPF